MKTLNLLIVLFICSLASAETYYVDIDGDPANGDGSIGNPFASLQQAVSEVTTQGDTIHINSGTYTQTTSVDIPVGVSLSGDGESSVLVSNIPNGFDSYILRLNSDIEGTDGDQVIHDLKFDGDNLSGDKAISISKRSNVKIFNCTFVDFFDRGIQFSGKGWNGGVGEPDTYAVGNEFYNNTVTNCAQFDGWARGGLMIGGQDGMLVYDNVFDETARGNGLSGQGIKFVNDGYLRNCKIFHNEVTTEQGSTNVFAIEIWNYTGGNIVYENVTHGGWGINTDEAHIGSSTFSVDIHHNYIDNATRATSNASGISFDGSINGVIVRGNIIKNCHYGIFFSVDSMQSGSLYSNDVKVYNNIIDGIGREGNWGQGIAFSTHGNSHLSNFHFYNNTIYTRYGYPSCDHIIQVPSGGPDWHTFTFRNNILIGAATAGLTLREGTSSVPIDTVIFENNLVFDCGNDNDPNFLLTPTNLSVQNNKKVDPLFISSTDFHLQANSPARQAGQQIEGYTVDLEGVEVTDPPNIGALQNEESPSSISANIYSNTKISLFPNPANGYFFIDFNKTPGENFILKIYDTAGRMIYEEIIKRESRIVKVPITLNPGLYTVQIMSKTYTSSSKVIFQ